MVLRLKDDYNFPIVFVGNKCDLEDERLVGRDEFANLAKEDGIQSYCSSLEVSAKACINISEAFFQLVRLIQAKNGKISNL